MPTGVPGSPQVYGPVHSCCPAGALRPDRGIMMLGASCDGVTSEVSKPEKDVEPDAEPLPQLALGTDHRAVPAKCNEQIAKESVHGIDAGETAPQERGERVARLLEHFCSQLGLEWRVDSRARPRGAHAVHAPSRIPHRGDSMWRYLRVDAFSSDGAQRQSQLL
ncbi:hypothetical protein Celaphus_00007232 [Cervus elaphus hippelaphus]|uniref:Uncharacterized protein n=1 Tax=Cervus elaphus hippelaphus TaxID=46360 RepID=A0A212CY43_CEREH|nr:hypothetical protein Celaphus_00007232 [Cervus elaphus hippelaphus]